MTPCVIRVAPDATARQGAAKLAYYGLTSVPVVEPSGRVVGVLSASDVLHLRVRPTPANGDGGNGQDAPRFGESTLDTTRVREIMLPVLFSIAPTASLAELAHLVEETGAERVVVSENGQLAGLVTTTDLLRALAEVNLPVGK
jgi:CBS domain-containing protein